MKSIHAQQLPSQAVLARSLRATHVIDRFLPAIVVLCVWLFVVFYNHGPPTRAAAANSSVVTRPLNDLWDELFADYWPMSLAMIFGSLIAGSTPLGGGVVAFPVAVLFLKFSAAQGRDFTVLIQSVGMNAATYLILRKSPHLVNFRLVATFVVVGVPGVLLGLATTLPPFYVILCFQTLVLDFAVTLFYLIVFAPRASPSAVPTPSPSSTVDESGGIDVAIDADDDGMSTSQRLLAHGSMWLAAFAGGWLTANIGSGSDILLYAFGLLGWNLLVPPSQRLPDNSLTASSVVVMGMLSLVTAVCRLLTAGISTEVLLCWGATSWIVCFGAPLGSLLLTPGMRAYLRIAFYLLAVTQFLGFAVIKIKAEPVAWAVFGVCTSGTIGLLWLHYALGRRSLQLKGTPIEQLSATAFKARLLGISGDAAGDK